VKELSESASFYFFFFLFSCCLMFHQSHWDEQGCWMSCHFFLYLDICRSCDNVHCRHTSRYCFFHSSMIYCTKNEAENKNDKNRKKPILVIKALLAQRNWIVNVDLLHERYNMWIGWLLQMQYTFQQVFDEYTSQKAMFDSVAMSLVEDVLHGKNGSAISLHSLSRLSLMLAFLLLVCLSCRIDSVADTWSRNLLKLLLFAGTMFTQANKEDLSEGCTTLLLTLFCMNS